MQDMEKELWQQLNDLVQACKCFQEEEAWEASFQKTPLACEKFDQQVKASEALLKRIPLPE